MGGPKAALPPPPLTNTGPRVSSAAQAAYNPSRFDVPFSVNPLSPIAGGPFTGSEFMLFALAGAAWVMGYALKSGAPWPFRGVAGPGGGQHTHEHGHQGEGDHTHHHLEAGNHHA